MLSIRGTDFITCWACAEMFKSWISRPNRIRFSKISCYRPLGPSGFGFCQKSKKKISCLCTFKKFEFAGKVPSRFLCLAEFNGHLERFYFNFEIAAKVRRLGSWCQRQRKTDGFLLQQVHYIYCTVMPVDDLPAQIVDNRSWRLLFIEMKGSLKDLWFFFEGLYCSFFCQ